MLPPRVVVLSGANGAGKSTAAEDLVFGILGIKHYVNADTIARGLSAFGSEEVAIEAGEVMLHRIRSLASQREDFGFETTLAARTLAPWLRGLQTEGYQVHLLHLWLRDEEMALMRVAERVRHGGHSIPEETIRRRYHGGMRNFFQLYQPLADRWQMYDNSRKGSYRRTIAFGSKTRVLRVKAPAIWDRLIQEYRP